MLQVTSHQRFVGVNGQQQRYGHEVGIQVGWVADIGLEQAPGHIGLPPGQLQILNEYSQIVNALRAIEQQPLVKNVSLQGIVGRVQSANKTE